MNFIAYYKTKKIPKTTYILSIVFAITGIIGIGGFVQQIVLRTTGMVPTLDLRDLSGLDFAKNLLFQVLPFLTGIVSIFFAVKKMLGSPISSLFGELSDGMKKIGFAFAITFVCFLLFNSLFSFRYGWVVGQILQNDFVVYVLLMMLFLVIQVGMEELLFRVFLPQVFIGMKMNKIIAILLASILFGVLHMNNPEMNFYGKWIVLLYILQGFFLGIITYLDRSLWLALGFHFTNNLLSLAVIGTENQVIKMPSIWMISTEHVSVYFMVLQVTITIIAFFLVGYRVFNWSMTSLIRNDD